MKFLVTGGAGYIGSHMVKFLTSKKHDVTVFDNLSSGNFKNIGNSNFVKLDLLDIKKLDKFMSKSKFDAVFHFAALSIVEESEKKPNQYYRNNVVATKNLIKIMNKYKINNLIFSSSASVYGKPIKKKISETHQLKPISIYGKNKKEIEIILNDKAKKNNFKSISFRYFNAAGADKSAEIGEKHNPETHLIPKILESIKNNKKYFHVYGNNYKTRDGTCVRDYVHVNDIVRAHYYGLKKFKNKRCVLNYNIGSEKGYSVLEIVKAAERVTKKKINIIFKKKRTGDPPTLVANCKKILRELKWRPKYKDINLIISSAWKWHDK
jgi:UDP-glucose 4-epimerase